MKLSGIIPIYLQDTRGVELSRYMKGNTKLGEGVYTYSRLPGNDEFGTCPGSSEECEAICYAKRIDGVVKAMYAQNSYTDDVPEIPSDAKLLRLHVSGDFNSHDYVINWITRMVGRPDVTMWTYTRSWRVPTLLPALEALRGLPNVQMFASMDQSITEEPPKGWRRAWIDGDARQGETHTTLPAHTDGARLYFTDWQLQQTQDGTKALICPEETKAVSDCAACGFCWKGQQNDVVFLKH